MLFIVHNPCLYSCHAWRNNNSVELLRYRRPRPTYLLADWSRYATSFSPSSNHRPSGNMTASATRIFRDRYCSVLKRNAQIFVADRLCYVTPNSHRPTRPDPTRHDKTVVSASRRVCGVNWILDDSRLSPTEIFTSEHVRCNGPVHTAQSDTTPHDKTVLSRRVGRSELSIKRDVKVQ